MHDYVSFPSACYRWKENFFVMDSVLMGTAFDDSLNNSTSFGIIYKGNKHGKLMYVYR